MLLIDFVISQNILNTGTYEYTYIACSTFQFKKKNSDSFEMCLIFFFFLRMITIFHSLMFLSAYLSV